MASEQPNAPRRIEYLKALCRTVPYHIVETVLAEPVETAITNQEFDGSILYADLVGFTSMCDRLVGEGPDGLTRVTRVLNGLFAALLERAVFPHKGYVIEFGGDSLSAVFREPDHAARAAAAGLAALRILHGEVGRLLGGHGRELMIRAGVASGPIRLPVLGDLAQRMALCAGPAARRALALQRQAAPNSLVVDRTTLKELGELAEVVNRTAEDAVLRALRVTPPLFPIDELAGRVELRVDEKVSLLEPFVPQPLAARLKSRPGSWWSEGELRRMVILFADLWGLEERASPATVTDVSRSIARAFRKYGGVLLKGNLSDRGHRLMVVFGLHHPSSNDPERALLAALEVNARIRAFTTGGGGPLGWRTGVHVGKVYLGAIGSAIKHDLTVIGDTVNVAARVASEAEPFEILATEAITAAVHEGFETSARLPIQVKGKRAPLQLFVVHSASAAHAHYVRRRQTRRFCAGRTEQRARLGTLIDDALAGGGRVVGLCGEAGTGKSFMLAEVIDRWTEAGGIGLLGRCRYSANAVPLAPIVQGLASYLGLTDTDAEGERRERIRAGLADLDLTGGGAELVALLQPVRRPDGTDEATIDLAEPEARERVLDSIAEFMERRVKRGRLLYVLEDLHFADTLTLQLASRLTGLSGAGAFLFLGTYRPVPLLRDLRRAFAEEIRLPDFTLAEAAELLCHEVGAQEVDGELTGFLWQRTKGNPGYLVEVIRFLNDRGLVTVRAGVAVPVHGNLQVLDDVVPPSLAHVALARLDELGAVERRVLRTASVIGRRFDRALLEHTVETEVETELLVAGMASLEGQGVIIPSPHLQQGFMFRDAVTRAVAYGTIPEGERREMHSRIADTLERLAPGDPRRVASVVAMHRERAEELLAAERWYDRAVRLAVRGGLDREARDLVDRWEAVVARLPASERPEPAAALRMAINKLVATARLGQPADAVRIGRSILTSPAWGSIEPEKRAVVDFWLGNAMAVMGQAELARERLRRVSESAPQRWLRCDAARELARLELWAGNRAHAEVWLKRGEEYAGEDTYRRAQLVLVRANLLNDAGELDAAEHLYREVERTAREHNQRSLVSAAMGNLAYCSLRRRDFGAAVAGFEKAAQLDHGRSDWLGEAIDLVNLGQTHAWAGNYEAAIPVLERALTVGVELGDELTVAEAKVHLGYAIAMARDSAVGEELCREGREAARAAQLREAEVSADLHLLEIAMLRGDATAARQRSRACAAHVDALTLPLFQAAWDRLTQRLASGDLGDGTRG